MYSQDTDSDEILDSGIFFSTLESAFYSDVTEIELFELQILSEPDTIIANAHFYSDEELKSVSKGLADTFYIGNREQTEITPKAC